MKKACPAFILRSPRVMKKKAITAVSLFALASLVLFSACSNGNISAGKDVIVGTDLVKYNRCGVEDFGFNVDLLTPKKNTKVEFVSFSGINTQGLSVTLVDETFDSLKNFKHDGYYLKLLGFVCKTTDAEVLIDSVTLRIDGEEAAYTFPVPIKHQTGFGNESWQVNAASHPLIVFTNSFETTEYTFDYIVDSDITWTDFSFNDFLEVKSATVLLDGKTVGQLDDILPLEVKKGTTITISGYLGLKSGSATVFDNICCDSYLTYSINGQPESTTVTNSLVCQGVSDELDAKQVIEHMTNK